VKEGENLKLVKLMLPALIVVCLLLFSAFAAGDVSKGKAMTRKVRR
jgi:hypothetical protein